MGYWVDYYKPLSVYDVLSLFMYELSFNNRLELGKSNGSVVRVLLHISPGCVLQSSSYWGIYFPRAWPVLR